MNKKLNESTQQSRDVRSVAELLREMRNAGYLEDRLPAGLTNRFSHYITQLQASSNPDDRSFDSVVCSILSKYVLDKKDFDRQVQYLHDLHDPEGIPFSRTYREPNMWLDALLRFADDNWTSFRWDEWYIQSLEELKKEFSSLHLKPLFYNSDVSIMENLPQLSTHSGFLYLETGLRKKGWHMVDIHRKYRKRLEKALKDGSFHRPLLIGFRHQASGEYDDDGQQTNTCKHKARVISMVDLYQIIAELTYAKPLQNYLSSETYYAGGFSDIDIAGEITNWRWKYDNWFSIDYSSFDQTISNWLINDVFDVIKLAFDMTDEQLAAFEVVRHDFVNKTFVTQYGLVESHKGVPSGSMFTQIMDSLVNRLVIETYFKFLKAVAEMMIMGDDNIIFTNAGADLEQLASYISHNFGLIIKTDDKTSVGSKDEDPKFLSKFWCLGERWRHPHLLLSRLLYPEKFRKYGKVKAKRFEYNVTPNGRIVSVKEVTQEVDVTPQEVILGYVLSYGKGMRELIDVQRFLRDFHLQDTTLDDLDSRYLPGVGRYQRDYIKL